jgi:hypothetical protein
MTRAAALLSFGAALAGLVAAGCAATERSNRGLRQEVTETAGYVVLHWTPFEAPPEWSADPRLSPGEILGVTYDVRVQRDGRILLERTGVEGDSLPVGADLPPAPGGKRGFYRWTVRPRIRTTRGTRLGVWSQSDERDGDDRCPIIPVPDDRLPAFSR